MVAVAESARIKREIVGRGRCCEALDDLVKGAAATCRHAEHHGEYMVAAARRSGLTIWPPALGNAEAKCRGHRAVGRRWRGIVVGMACQPARDAADGRLERGRRDKRHHGHRPGIIFVPVKERLRQIVVQNNLPCADRSVDGKRKRPHTLCRTELPHPRAAWGTPRSDYPLLWATCESIDPNLCYTPSPFCERFKQSLIETGKLPGVIKLLVLTSHECLHESFRA